MIPVEICIEASDAAAVGRAVNAAYQGGAATVELCAAMHLDELTPAQACMAAARRAFEQRPGLMVMIRPRAGDFCYSSAEMALMLEQIDAAAAAGADGVVFGVLRAGDQCIDLDATQRLLAAAQRHGLMTTMHRAFDATPDPDATLDALLELGFDRVLTSGVPWGQRGSALDGAERLAQTIHRAQDRIEVVLGGGINPANVGLLLAQLPLHIGCVSVHAYSGAQVGGRTTIEAVRALAQAARDVSEVLAVINGELQNCGKVMLIERGIPEEWVWRTISFPDRKKMHFEDNNLHYTKAIKERGGRILHVVVNPNVQPNRVVTVFFDRRMRRES
jgi:copper homeostasis protein